MPDEFALAEPFGIDGGELSTVSVVQAFTLGVEWAMIRAELDAGLPFSRMFHSDNHDRVVAMCERRGIKWSITNHDDWPMLTVS